MKDLNKCGGSFVGKKEFCGEKIAGFGDQRKLFFTAGGKLCFTASHASSIHPSSSSYCMTVFLILLFDTLDSAAVN